MTAFPIPLHAQAASAARQRLGPALRTYSLLGSTTHMQAMPPVREPCLPLDSASVPRSPTPTSRRHLQQISAGPHDYEFIGCVKDGDYFNGRTYFGGEAGGKYLSAVLMANGAPYFAVARDVARPDAIGHGFAFQNLSAEAPNPTTDIEGCMDSCADQAIPCGKSIDGANAMRVWAIYMIKPDKLPAAASPVVSVQSLPPPSPSPEDPGLSTGDKIALGVGLGVGIPTLIAGIIGAYYAYKGVQRRRGAARGSFRSVASSSTP